MTARRSAEERFWEKVVVDASGCWLWTSALDQGGYPILWIGDGRSVRAHRFAYELMIGAIPAETLDHLCRVRCCVYPLHLDPCSAGENARRSPLAPYNLRAAAAACARGHLFDEANTARHHGRRECRACNAERARRRRAAA